VSKVYEDILRRCCAKRVSIVVMLDLLAALFSKAGYNF